MATLKPCPAVSPIDEQPCVYQAGHDGPHVKWVPVTFTTPDNMPGSEYPSLAILPRSA